MNKIFIISFLLVLSFYSYGQRSLYSQFGINYSNQKELFWIDGVSIYNQFGIKFKNRVFAIAELKFSYAGADDIGERSFQSNIIDIHRDYAFGAYPGEPLDNGIITFKKSYSAKYISFNLDLGVRLELIKKSKHSLDMDIGLSFAYVDKMYTGSSIDGEFFSIFYGDQFITIISPLFIRYFDIGYNVKFNYSLKLNEKIQIGLRGGIVNLKSNYGIFGVGPFVKMTI